MKAVIYIRVSTEGQARDEHVSLDTQETACRRYAEQQGMEIVGSYQDVQSGTDPARDNYQRLLADALAHNFEAVVTYNSSRWGRDAVEAIRSVRALERAGVHVYSTQGDMQSRLVHGINAMMDEEHSLRLSRVIRGSLARLAERGDWPGSKPPIGYRREGKRVIADEITGPLVHHVFEMAAAGSSIAACAITMKERGHAMTKGGVKAMLTNPFYTGQVRWMDPASHLEFEAARDARDQGQREYHLYEGNHSALIDKALWQSTQDAIGRRMFKLHRRNDTLSAGLVACGHCGYGAQWHRMAKRNKPGYYAYYYCRPQRSGNPACAWSVRVDGVNDWLHDTLVRMVVDEDSLDRAAALLDAQRSEIVAKSEAERKTLERTLSTLRQRSDRLMDAMLDGTISREQYRKRHGEFQRDITRTEQELTTFRPAEVPNYAEIIAFWRQLPAALAKGDNRQLRPLLRQLIRRIEVRSKTEDLRLISVVEGL